MNDRYKIYFLIALLIIFSNCKQPIDLKTQSKEASIQLSFTHYSGLADLELACLDNKMNVTIINTTDSIIRLYEEDNSWGYYNISFEIKTQDSLYIIRKKEHTFWKNVPTYTILNPDESQVFDINLKHYSCYLENDKPTIRDDYQGWEGLPKKEYDSAKIKVIYQSKEVFDLFGNDTTISKKNIKRTFLKLESRQYDISIEKDSFLIGFKQTIDVPPLRNNVTH